MTLLSKIIFIVTVTLTFDPKINRVIPLPQENHVATFGKDPIYRTKVIVRKPVWTPARRPRQKNKYSNSRVVRKKISERNKKP